MAHPVPPAQMLFTVEGEGVDKGHTASGWPRSPLEGLGMTTYAIDDEKVHLPLNVWGLCNQLVIFPEFLMVELKVATGKAE